MNCIDCNGSGKYVGLTSSGDCRECNGSGKAPIRDAEDQADPVTEELVDPSAPVFSTDGSKMYVAGTMGDVHEYDLEIPGDPYTAVYNKSHPRTEKIALD